MHGTFVARPTDPHVRRRAEILALGSPVLPPPPAPPAVSAADLSKTVLEDFGGRLRETGIAGILLDSPLSDHAFRAFGETLGIPQPETDPAVLPRVSLDVVLNLVSEGPATDDVRNQPFAANELSLHTEGSGRPAARQPRHIVLMCCDPGEDAVAAQTVLTPMKGVARRLAPRDSVVLSGTTYRRNHQGPYILREVDGRQVFSFRDFLAEPLEWTYDGPEATAEEVDSALRGLLEAMYTPDDFMGVRWERGLLLAIDNTFHFHGRRAGAFSGPGRRRHLKRLRII